MGPQVETVTPHPVVPARADTVVIGGGIIGVSTALFLAERGVDVVLVEKGHIAGEQSSRNWGWVRKANRDLRELDLIRESLDIWTGLDARIGGDTGFVQSGVLYSARKEAEVAGFSAWVKEAAQAGIAAEILSAGEMARLLPGDTDLPRAGLYCATDGRAEPQKAAPAIARAAARLGAKIVTDCAARGIETAGGQVVCVVTERGPIACRAVVVAGGAWTRRLLSDLGIRFPQLKTRASVGRTAPIAGGPDCAFSDDVIGYRRRADGGLTLANGMSNVAPITPDSFRFLPDFLDLIKMDWRNMRLTLDSRFWHEWRDAAPVPLDRPSPYEACRVLDPAPDRDLLDRALGAVKRRFPALAGARFVQTWAGYIDVMPDIVPVISTVDQLSGLVVASGFSGHGFGIGPGAGHLVADLVTGARPIVDPTAFRLSRFSDGSRPKPQSGL